MLPGIHVFLWLKVVDGRNKPGHDDNKNNVSLLLTFVLINSTYNPLVRREGRQLQDGF
jgi:hypothetical protein